MTKRVKICTIKKIWKSLINSKYKTQTPQEKAKKTSYKNKDVFNNDKLIFKMIIR